MKKIIVSFLTIFFSIQNLFISACTVRNIPSLPANATSNDIKILFKNSPYLLEPVYFWYLKNINGEWIHTDFKNDLGTYKILDGQISLSEYNNLSFESKDFFDKFAISYKAEKQSGDIIYDFIDSSIRVENSFVKKIEYLDIGNIKPSVNISSTLALTIFNSYNVSGKMLLSYTMNQDDYYTFENNKLDQLINSQIQDNKITIIENTNPDENYKYCVINSNINDFELILKEQFSKLEINDLHLNVDQINKIISITSIDDLKLFYSYKFLD
ncbi:hypothetical protein [Spiroplasma endosymbiont of Labia minor]|uniref:hypothetical protein n=1 Tax=Spiroplasma endosymbiont of Labia minor TaxID=3066305 RepID=UPI0030CE39E7